MSIVLRQSPHSVVSGPRNENEGQRSNETSTSEYCATSIASLQFCQVLQMRTKVSAAMRHRIPNIVLHQLPHFIFSGPTNENEGHSSNETSTSEYCATSIASLHLF
jgi:hypothetical protein